MRAFLFGCVAYPLLEVCYRGRTHWTMSLCGGLGMMGLSKLAKSRRPLWQCALMGGAGITAMELACGLLFNRDHRVWDYRRVPLNVGGQICLPYALLWCGLSGAVTGVIRLAGRR